MMPSSPQAESSSGPVEALERSVRRSFRCPLPAHDDRTPSATYYERDHRVHCFGCGRTFDVIVNDAFSGARPLGALGNAEGAALIRAHLSKRGMYLANVRTPLEGRKAKVLADVRDAFAREFGSVEVIPERPEEPGVLANNVLVARVEA